MLKEMLNPQNYFWNPHAIPVFLSSVILIFIGVFVALKNKTRLNISFSIWMILITFWLFGNGLAYMSKYDWLVIELYNRFEFLGVCFISITGYWISLCWDKELLKKQKKYVIAGIMISSIFYLTNLKYNYILSGAYDYFWGRYFKNGAGGTIFIIYWIIPLIATLINYIDLYKKAAGLKKRQYGIILIATFIVYLGATDWLPCYGLEIYPFGFIPVLIFSFLMAYAIIRYHLMEIKIVFTRAGIFLAVYTVVLGIPFIVLKRTGSGLFATSLAVVFATIGPLTYRFLQMKAEAAILAQQRRYQRILLRAAVGMVTEHDLARLSKLIVFTLKSTIRLNFSAIFIIDKKSNLYQLKSIRGEPNIGECVKSFDAKDPFIGYLKENRGNFFFENAPEQIRDSSDILSKSRIVIPVLIGDELLGFVFLGEKTNTHPYSDEDIDVFKILSRQAALAIENCIFFEESKDAQERMFAAEKLASIGGMADGIAHQIKNRLNLFSLTGGELKFEIRNFVAKHNKLVNSNPELDKTFKYLNEISASILDNVKRTDGIIKGMLDFAKVEKKENLFAVFSFKEIIKLSCRLLMLKHEAVALPLSVKIYTEDAVYGVKSQLTEVIYNLLDNAYEAIEERKMRISAKKEPAPFIPAIELSLTHTQDRQIIKISDNGIGIKEEDKPKIFAPFFTTKTSYKSGSGIGVYVAKRIIEENHKGKIRFTSNYMEGTSFIIELPKKDNR